MLSEQRWTEDDLERIGDKLSEFAMDPFNPPTMKRDLLEQVSSIIRRFEAAHDVTVT